MAKDGNDASKIYTYLSYYDNLNQKLVSKQKDKLNNLRTDGKKM